MLSPRVRSELSTLYVYMEVGYEVPMALLSFSLPIIGYVQYFKCSVSFIYFARLPFIPDIWS